ncbi:cuticle protein 16.5 [Stomoxys calcitrans]|uniref:cuticle protein 16.5 n=1 Tax=Stomoxys calcitrans TaxID=35570 RepID=UPI0027E2CE48|nr:cuticle protein 16.5 [Stomoxys calcitrans]
MFKFFAIVLMAVLACVAAKPGVVAPLAYNAPVVAAPYAASAVVSQEYHGNFAAPYVAAPYVAAASPYVAAASPYVAAASPYVAAPYAAAPYAAATYAAAAPYVAAPYSAPLLLKK